MSYRDVPTRMFIKAAKAQGIPAFQIAQLRHYVEEVRGGTYAIGAPTDHVEQVTGRPAENFEMTARRYIEHPELVTPGFKIGSKLDAFGLMLKTLLAQVHDLDRWESERGYPLLVDSSLVHESEEWRRTAEQKRLALLELPQARVR